MSSFIVETSEEEPILAVCRYVGEVSKASSGFGTKCETLLAGGRSAEVIAMIMELHVPLFNDGLESDVESCFNIVCNLASRLSADAASNAARKIAGSVASEVGEKSQLRMKVLFALYNAAAEGKTRYAVFMDILRYARAASIPEVVLPSMKRVEAWAKEWDLGAEESRALFLECSNFMRDYKPSSRSSFDFLLSYLSTFEGAPAGALAAVKEEAVRAVVEFIKSPDNFQCDLLDMSSVCALEKDPKSSGLFKLLSIFLTERLQSFLDFCSANPSLLDSYGLKYDDCVSKMRLMSLAALATESPSGEIDYGTVRDTLMVKDGEVEEWVVRAISLKLVEAKMDQLRGVVVISRATQRVFSRPQWEDLRSKLAQWRENVAGVTRRVAKAGAVPQGIEV